MRYMVTDDRWAILGPRVDRAKQNRQGQKPDPPDRPFFEALLDLARTGVPWRDLPGDFGSWDAVDNRFRRWVSSGSLQALFELLTADPQRGDVRRVRIGSTIIRAHPHAAGARRRKKRSARPGRRRTRASVAAGAGSPARSS
jgi:putative transposase